MKRTITYDIFWQEAGRHYSAYGFETRKQAEAQAKQIQARSPASVSDIRVERFEHIRC